MRTPITFLLIALLFCACKTDPKAKTGQDLESDDWISLFDGTDIKGWRAYNESSLPEQWVVQNGMLTFDTQRRSETDQHSGNDIIYAAETFDNFELYLEWKLPEGGNSGIFYHIKEGYQGMSEVSPEYQLLDDLQWEEINNAQLEEWQKTGADYAMYPPDKANKVTHPAGTWNTSRIRFTPELAEHWLNGKKILSFVPWSQDWHQRKAAGKWKNFPDYGKFKTGYIGLQDHDSPLWFRNIKIKKL